MVATKMKRTRGNKLARYTRHLQIRVTPEQYRAVRMLAASMGTSTQGLMEGVLTQLLSKDTTKGIAEIAGLKDDSMQQVAHFMTAAPPAMKAAVMAIVTTWRAEQSN